MTEQMLREALHDAMTAGAAPPPMSSTVMVRVARRARNPCRVGWSGASCAALVATIAVTASVLPRPPAGISTGLSGGVPAVAPVYAPATAQAWPTGPDGTPQENRTATAGARYEQGCSCSTRSSRWYRPASPCPTSRTAGPTRRGSPTGWAGWRSGSTWRGSG